MTWHKIWHVDGQIYVVEGDKFEWKLSDEGGSGWIWWWEVRSGLGICMGKKQVVVREGVAVKQRGEGMITTKQMGKGIKDWRKREERGFETGMEGIGDESGEKKGGDG
ncbi:hypothetical protein ACH5RR_034339 [Cinchona calisaya]|uniref:Uncharacterized protein n=1 Tax=Cinchona calisaya TaxID=153742 RepID=A0ABD2YG38_9GENT